MILKVCVGSACHIKGSYDVIKIITKIIEEEGLGKEVELKACFCLNNCTEGVSVIVDGEEKIYSFSKENAEKKFKDIIEERVL
ncbi:(2Fe-2S) ferredoxin domain-containing protein [Psychrilyobacter atlanticus]|uniref:(2Fe-2S) ferredoxin domain-containing protein n=1 Tax=Psychrilyobacter atlanticus TaxID=271091 RepID=UPI000424E5A3|nr:(2Fe-2S) ferredoxin domain-containing protein [Psychrilyobacter atlanticus]